MNAKEKANKDQINQFISAYYSEWRFIHILSIQKQLSYKYSYFQEIIAEIKETDNSAGDKTIAQEITNGLLFDAIQQSIQYIEDLFAFINASLNKDLFIRNIVQYKAGKIDNSISSFKNSKTIICKYFHFPNYLENEIESERDEEIMKVMNEGISRLGVIVEEIIEHYKKYKFFYNQYKHGLSIALRPYNDYNDEQVELDKKGEFGETPIIALDSLNFKNASKNQYGNTGHLFMPAFSENISPWIPSLEKENNLLRYVMSPKYTNIENITEIAGKTKRCLQILIHNFRAVLNDDIKMHLRLPSENIKEVIEFEIDILDNTQ